MNVIYRKWENKTLTATNCDSIWFDDKTNVVYIQFYSNNTFCRCSVMSMPEYESIIQRGIMSGNYDFSGYLFQKNTMTSYALKQMFR